MTIKLIKTAWGLALIIFLLAVASCKMKKKPMDQTEQISMSDSSNAELFAPDSTRKSIKGNASFKEIITQPNAVVLTGTSDYRLVSIYKINESPSSNTQSEYYSDDEDQNEKQKHFMPGIDILYGYYLLNVGHYGIKTGKLSYLFDRPVLIKTLYYPSFEQDSLDKKPINRDYYMVSVFDEDSNKDGFINNKDLRRLYYVNSDNTTKIQLIPPDYSVIRSQYDSQNDAMYVFASKDENKDGSRNKKEPIHIFWIDLKNPVVSKALY